MLYYQTAVFGFDNRMLQDGDRSVLRGICDSTFGWLINFGEAVTLESDGLVQTLHQGGVLVIKRGSKSPFYLMGKQKPSALFICLLEGERSFEVFQGFSGKIDQRSLLGLQPRFRERTVTRSKEFMKVDASRPFQVSMLLHNWFVELEWAQYEFQKSFKAFCELQPHELIAHPQPVPTIAELAKRLGTTEPHIANLIRKRWSLPPGAALAQLKLHQGARLLRETKQDVGLVALAVGYASRSAFVSKFRAEFGVTPKEYRAEGITNSLEQRMLNRLKNLRIHNMGTDNNEKPLFIESSCHDRSVNRPTMQIFHAELVRNFSETGKRLVNLGAYSEQPLCLWLLFLEGERYLQTSNERILFGPGSMVAMQSDFNLSWLVEKNQEEAFIVLVGWPQCLAGIQERTCQKYGWITHLDISDPFFEYSKLLIAQLSRSLSRVDREANYMLQSKLSYQWVCEWQRVVSDSKASQRENIDLGKYRISLSGNRIGKAISSVKSYADLLGYSLSHTNRLMNKGYKKPIGERLRVSRLIRARALLLEVDDSVETIARKCGYSGAYALIRPFKKLFGVTPHAFRIANKL